ncbi:hypothetical protein MTQ01_18645 [Streptomyces sp. XM4193]|uniref:hypothetical protein n=1 Tax=Streptomyces sp. XM4193 TaxID=2929782 RepID=UPI001FFA599C|nr:hypothetical protein [Streptomyces sp. XM4193]MCK1798009.1 hypothetical protein [Streptomyces sp. XM4193]
MSASNEAVLAGTARTVFALLTEGPSEITSVISADGDERDHRRELLCLFAAGVRPGSFRDVWVDWPIDLIDGAAVTLADWLVARHRAWPQRDPGALFESVGVCFPTGGTRQDGSRRMPRGESRTVLRGREWARALAEEPREAQLVAAGAALGLLAQSLLPHEGDLPVRDDGVWKFPGRERDVGARLREFLARMLSDERQIEEAVEVARRAWSTAVGVEQPPPARRSTRRPGNRDGVDRAAAGAALPWARHVLETAEEARRSGSVRPAEVFGPVDAAFPAEAGTEAEPVRRAVLAGLVVAGVRPRTVRTGEQEVRALQDRFDRLASGSPDAEEAFVPFEDAGDPLDVRHDPHSGSCEPLTRYAWLCSCVLLDAGGNHRRRDGEAVPLALLVPAAVALVESHRRSGDWWRRTAFRLDRFYDALDREATGRAQPSEEIRTTDQLDAVRTADLLEHRADAAGRPYPSGCLAARASQAAQDNWGTRLSDTALATALLVLDSPAPGAV